jgi:hypothetical protein
MRDNLALLVTPQLNATVTARCTAVAAGTTASSFGATGGGMGISAFAAAVGCGTPVRLYARMRWGKPKEILRLAEIRAAHE